MHPPQTVAKQLGCPASPAGEGGRAGVLGGGGGEGRRDGGGAVTCALGGEAPSRPRSEVAAQGARPYQDPGAQSGQSAFGELKPPAARTELRCLSAASLGDSGPHGKVGTEVWR